MVPTSYVSQTEIERVCGTSFIRQNRGHGLKLVQQDPLRLEFFVQCRHEEWKRVIDPHAEFPDLLQDRMGNL